MHYSLWCDWQNVVKEFTYGEEYCMILSQRGKNTTKKEHLLTGLNNPPFCGFFPTYYFIIGEFHTMHPDHIYFLFLLGLSFHPCIPCLSPKYTKYNLFCPCTHWSIIKRPVAGLLKQLSPFLCPIQKMTTVKKYTSSSLS